LSDIRPYDGKKLVLPGAVVQEGELLISGVTDDVQAGTRFLRGMGKVYARTWYTLRCTVGVQVREKQHTDKVRVRYALCWGNRRFNFYGDGIGEENCDKLVERTKLALPGGIALPLTVVKETCRFYEETPVERSQTEAETLARTVLGTYLQEGMVEGKVERENYATVMWDGMWLTELNAQCHEQIGEFQPLPMQEERLKAAEK